MANIDIRPLTKVKKKNKPKIIGSVELLISLKAPIEEFTVMLLKKQTAARKRLPITKARRNKNTIFVPYSFTDFSSNFILYYSGKCTITQWYWVRHVPVYHDLNQCFGCNILDVSDVKKKLSGRLYYYLLFNSLLHFLP